MCINLNIGADLWMVNLCSDLDIKYVFLKY